MRIGYLGPTGTFTHVACQKAIDIRYPSASELVPFGSLGQLFDALHSGNTDAIFTPIENSIEGPVNQVFDGLIHSKKACIDFMITTPIKQSLLSFNPAIQPHDISTIISMPHAIAQCYTYIKAHCPNATIHHAPSTSGAVPMIDALSLPKASSVVIGHAGISNFFPIHVVEENIHDQKENTTQFGMILPNPATESHYNDPNASCMLAFSPLKDTPGSLLDVLAIFKHHHINLTKILSRPEKSSMGTYVFFIEFGTFGMSLPLTELFDTMRHQCLYFQPLGIYSNHYD
jgi:prephenate dehydratase